MCDVNNMHFRTTDVDKSMISMYILYVQLCFISLIVLFIYLLLRTTPTTIYTYNISDVL